MNKKITTYDELLEEKERLQQLFKAQRELLRADIQDIKAEFAPLKAAFSVVGKFTSRDKNNNWAVSATANTLIDIVVKKLILGRAGWLTKLAVPFLVKNFSSHVLADNKDKIVRGFFSLFGKKGKKPATTAPAGPEPATNGFNPVVPAETRED